MTEERLGLDDLTDEERLAFGALLRAMVSLDGVFSADEKAMFNVLAKDLGDEAFWAMLESAKSVNDPAEILKLAGKVERPQARELLFYGLSATSNAGDNRDKEKALLAELRTMWDLEIKDEK